MIVGTLHSGAIVGAGAGEGEDDGEGEALPLLVALVSTGTSTAPRILPSTASDSVPSSTVCDCLSEDPPAAPLARKLEPRSSEVVEPVLLDETREAVDARAERCCCEEVT